MASSVTRQMFLNDAVGRTFSDVVEDPDQPFDAVLNFFRDEGRIRRMEESEIHHDRPPLAGVVRELESLPSVDEFLSNFHTHKSKRFRQAIGALVRLIMESRGWRKTGRKGSLGVRAASDGAHTPKHNSGGLAFWFVRAERYECGEGKPFRGVRERSQEYTVKSTRSSKRAVKGPGAANRPSSRNK
jgi:hypothetical protein